MALGPDGFRPAAATPPRLAELLRLPAQPTRLTRALVQDGALSCDFSASKLLVYQDAPLCRRARANALPGQPGRNALGRDECLAAGALADIGQRVVGTLHEARPVARALRVPGAPGRARCGWARACGGCAAARSRRWKPARARCRPTPMSWPMAWARSAVPPGHLQPLIYPLKGWPDLCAGTGRAAHQPERRAQGGLRAPGRPAARGPWSTSAIVTRASTAAGSINSRGAALSAAPGAGRRTRGMGWPAAGAADGKAADRPRRRARVDQRRHGALGFTLAAGRRGVGRPHRRTPSPISDTLFQW